MLLYNMLELGAVTLLCSRLMRPRKKMPINLAQKSSMSFLALLMSNCMSAMELMCCFYVVMASRTLECKTPSTGMNDGHS